jgi:hypothetical protein
MKVELNGHATTTICLIAFFVTACFLVFSGVMAGKHEREMIVKATTCEQVAAISGHFSNILMCKK